MSNSEDNEDFELLGVGNDSFSESELSKLKDFDHKGEVRVSSNLVEEFVTKLKTKRKTKR